MSNPVLLLTDGTTQIDLLTKEKQNGLFLNEWVPSIAGYKNDGIWRDSGQADGRRLADRKWANVNETFDIKAAAYEQDRTIYDMQDVRRLLEKAADYWVANWQDEPVWIEARAACETNTRYGLVYSGRIPEDDNPYNQPFYGEGNAVMDDLQLIIERIPWWLGYAPLNPCDESVSEVVVLQETVCDPSYLTFDGSASLCNCGNGATIDDLPDFAVAGRGQITVEAWIRARGWGEANLGVISAKNNLGNGWAFLLNAATPGIYAQIDGAVQNAISASVAYGSSMFNEWHHVLMCYDETGGDTPAARTIYFAVDGVWATVYATQQVSIGNYNSDVGRDLIVGNNAFSSRTFDGDIAWVRVSDSIRYTVGTDFEPDERCLPPATDANTMLLLTHYPGSGTVSWDRSGNLNHGVLTSTTWSCDCEVTTTGNSPCWPKHLEFNNDSSLVNCGRGVSLDDIPDFVGAARGDITAQAWIRADGYGEGNQGYIIGKTNWFLRVSNTVGLRAAVVCGAQSAVSECGLDEFTADGEWHHVLMAYSEVGTAGMLPRFIYLAVDGVWVTSYPTQQGSIGAYATDVGADLIIGNVAAATAGFNGGIAWIKVSDKIEHDPVLGPVFSPEPRCQLPPIDANTMCQVIYEGTGTTTYDRSGNDNDGTITDGVWDCDCEYTDSQNVECNCVEAGNEQGWRYEGWQVHDANPANVTDIIETSGGRLVACDDNSQVWFTDDGSAPWTAAATPPAPNVFCYSMIEASDGYLYLLGRDTVTGRAECWRSTDGGDNWTQRTNDITGAALGGGLQVNSITEFSGLAAFYVGPPLFVAARNGIYYTIDGGVTWIWSFGTGGGVDNPLCVYAWTDGYIYASISGTVGDYIIRSDDGLVWEYVPLALSLSCICITGLSDGYLYAAEGGTRLHRTTDGINWSLVCSTPGMPQDDLILADDGIYYGADGDIVRATNPTDWGDTYNGVGIQTIVQYSGNGLIYAGELGSIVIQSESVTVGRDDTCRDEVFVSNKANIAQLTDIFVYDASIATYIPQFPAAALPFFLLPDPVALGDIVYFGIDSTIEDIGPYCSLVFDILQPLVLDGTLIWEYSQAGPAWATLNVSDGTTSGGGIPLSTPGVNSVHWVPPTDWAAIAVNGVTARWVRLRVSVFTTHIQAPVQQNRDVYTAVSPSVDIDDLQVQGDIPALLRVKARNRSDEDYYETKDELDLLDNRLLIGLRTLGRGASFTSFINLAEDGVVANSYAQNPIGVYVEDGAGTTTGANPRAAAGIACVHTTPPTGSVDTYADAVAITFGPSVARDFYGTYHIFLRAQLEEPSATPSGDDEDVRVRLKIQSGSGGISKITQHKRFVGWDANGEVYKDFQMLDFGRIDLPVTDLFKTTELPDEFTVTVQISSAAGTSLEVNLYDLILVPVDEWAGDFIDSALEDDSGVGNGYRLDADSTTYPKRRIRSLVRGIDPVEFIKASYQPITPGPAILQANADQRLWFVAARAIYLGKATAGAGVVTLTDSYSDFLRAGVRAGMVAYDITGATSTGITAVTKTTCTCTDAIWTAGDEYMIICNGIYRSEPWAVHSIQLEHNPRYLSMRGSR